MNKIIIGIVAGIAGIAALIVAGKAVKNASAVNALSELLGISKKEAKAKLVNVKNLQKNLEKKDYTSAQEAIHATTSFWNSLVAEIAADAS
jgi:hypothetical protein